ncbi:18456_t:CDS:2, partial [Dentiscutata erythropus]
YSINIMEKENPPVDDSEQTRKKHAESEQKRRDEFKIRLNTLRELLASTPYQSNNASKIDLLKNVTFYIKSLHDKLEGIQVSLNQSRANWDEEKETLLNEINQLNEKVNRLNNENNYLDEENNLLLSL